MFTKLDMNDNQSVFTKYIELRHDEVISDVTADQFRLDFCIFRTCEYNNLISLHPIFTKPVLTNNFEFRHDDVISDVISGKIGP